MLRSLFSAVSGLRSHQTMMDVVGNNIANVNTAGFKSSSTVFEDTLSQVVRAGGGPQGLRGGINPAQVGLGVRVGGITTNFGQGATQVTGRATDVALQGDGFFVVKQDGQTLYSRAGAFSFDASGQLVNPDGALVQGWGATQRPGEHQRAGRHADAADRPDVPPQQTRQRQRRRQPVVGGSGRHEVLQLDRHLRHPGPGDPRHDDLHQDRRGHLVAERHGPRRQRCRGAGGLGQPEVGRGQQDLRPHDDRHARRGPAGRRRAHVRQQRAGDPRHRHAPSTQFASADTAGTVDQDGAEMGTLESFTLDPGGQLIGVFSNGVRQTLGQVAVASFTNPPGLEKVSGSLYAGNANSGVASVGVAGNGGRGTLASGALEMSNVDLAQEFTQLIVAQRGFQANSKVITASDEILQDLVNLKR